MAMNKTMTISARIPQEDAEFISQLSIENAKTPSDKLRAIISEVRLRNEKQQDFRGCLTTIQDMIKPVSGNILETELKEQTHSELVQRTLEWLPDMMAFILSSGNSKQGAIELEQLSQIEHGISDRIFRLIESTLQLAITQRSSCYNPSEIHDRVSPSLDLLNAINSTHSIRNKKEL